VTGILCPSRDARAISDAVTRLVSDGDLRKRLGDAARERLRTVFDVAARAQKLVEVYNSLPARGEVA